MGCIAPEAHACAFSIQETRAGAANVHPQALGVNARCGCQNIRYQTGWRLRLREIFSQLRPASTSANSGPHAEQLRA